MPISRRLGIRGRLILNVLALVAISLWLLGVMVLRQSGAFLASERRERGRALATVVEKALGAFPAGETAAPGGGARLAAVQELLASLAEDPGMPAQSAAKAVTGDPAWLGPAVRSGEMLLQEFIEALGWTHVEAAARWYATLAGNLTGWFAIVGEVGAGYRSWELEWWGGRDRVEADVYSFLAGSRFAFRGAPGVTVFAQMLAELRPQLIAEGVPEHRVGPPRQLLDLRYVGQDSSITVPRPDDGDYRREFERMHRQLSGFYFPDREPEVHAARMELVGVTDKPAAQTYPISEHRPVPCDHTQTYFNGRYLETAVYLRTGLAHHLDDPQVVEGADQRE